MEFLNRTGVDEDIFEDDKDCSPCELASCKRVLTTQIGLVAVDVAIPIAINN